MNCRDLEIWQLARNVAIEVHEMTLTKLPKFEQYETGSQIRRSAKSIRSNIVEGFGRRRYKGEFIRFLTYAHASWDETIDHLESLRDTRSLTDERTFHAIGDLLQHLGGKLNRFIASVERSHRTPLS